jgi:hypothetical protein
MESTPSSLCPLLSAAGVPDCPLNPSLIPLFLGLAALCALGYLGIVVYDFWRQKAPDRSGKGWRNVPRAACPYHVRLALLPGSL